MIYKHVRAADLNLLPAFQILMEERNVTKAAEKMNLTQPAMSRTLERLRHLFQDEILVRANNAYEPTQRATQISRELDKILPRLETLLAVKDFSPFETRAVIRIAATDYAVATIFPNLLKSIAIEAPNIELDVRPWTEAAFGDLEANNLDLVFWVEKAPAGLKGEVLFQERFVCLVREDHPIGDKPLSLTRYLEYPHVIISVMKRAQLVIDKALGEKGLERRVLARTPYFASAVLLLKDSDAILSIGKRLANKLECYGRFKELAPPMEIASYSYLQIWHPRTENDPMLSWLRLAGWRERIDHIVQLRASGDCN